MINYDAELKKYKMAKKWRKLAFGSLGRTVGGQWWLDFLQPSSDRDAGRLLRKLGRLPKREKKKKQKAALASPTSQPNRCLVCSIFSAPIHPVQLFHLLHTPNGSAADSQGLSHCHRWDLKDLMWGRVKLADSFENWKVSSFLPAKQTHFPLEMEKMRVVFTQSGSFQLWRESFTNSVGLAWWNCWKICLSPPPR